VSENLWPTDFGEVAVMTPVSMLREQALALGQRTANLVIGHVNAGVGAAGRFRHVLSFYCPPLGYRAPLLSIEHGVDLYPVDLIIEGEERKLSAVNPDDFAAKLKDVFSREKTKKTIASLIAQSK
jgi:hypothetical protein